MDPRCVWSGCRRKLDRLEKKGTDRKEKREKENF